MKALHLILVVLILLACSEKKAESSLSPKPLFRLVPKTESGITFENTIRDFPYGNILIYQYFYNGGGVASGDLNGDGLPEVFFTGNTVGTQLYLNKGKLKFEDITQKAGIRNPKNAWATGVSMADVNGDGLLDIYVCYSGILPPELLVNQLYINQGTNAAGIPTFVEKGKEYGLADDGYSTQAAFFDYDLDHDLDMILLGHDIAIPSNMDKARITDILKKKSPHVRSKLFQNTGNKFIEVTDRAGLAGHQLSYGLGVGISDLDQDGDPDFYICNDYLAPDYLYINNGDGTFTNKIFEQLALTSLFSMGNALTDVNNDGLTDIFTLDMLPEDNKRQKLLYMPDNYELYNLLVDVGFHHQYMRNMLHVNNGDGTFSEVGQLAGISNTDWSWAPLFADFDNDGWKDLFVTNGFMHDFTNQDFLKYNSSVLPQMRDNIDGKKLLEVIQKMPSSNVRNYLYRNTGTLKFEQVNDSWGITENSNSNGATYADLDADGDLDLITNNINAPAFVYENTIDPARSNFLQVSFKGLAGNANGIGAKIRIHQGGKVQYQELYTSIGYQSSVPPIVHFGLGEETKIDSMTVVWLGGKTQTLRGISNNQLVTLSEANAVESLQFNSQHKSIFTEVPLPISYTTKKVTVNDLKRQPLLINPISSSGPCMARGDVNKDGLPDVFIGGDLGQPGQLWLMNKHGSFENQNVPAFESDKSFVDTKALFFDANNDGELDLYVASGGYHSLLPEDPRLQDRLYFNRNGTFIRSNLLPPMLTSTGTVAPYDVNGDGFIDLFVGGRVVPGRFPETPSSYLLINDGSGGFSDQTATYHPELQKIGMVTAAEWVDLDGDDKKELVVVGDWMPVTIFSLTDGKLMNTTSDWFSSEQSGWWNSLQVLDLEGDGIPELLAGNQGTNTQAFASPEQPAELFFKDFDDNGAVDPFLCFYIQGTSYPFVTRDELMDQVSAKRTKFPTYASYADATIRQIFTPEEMESATLLKATTLETTLFKKGSSAKYEAVPLPLEVQFAPVFCTLSGDYTGDSIKDLLFFGNINHARLRFGKYSANYGILVKGNGDGSFSYVPQHQSGLSIKGDVRSVLEIGDLILLGFHNQSPIAIKGSEK